MLLDAPVPSGDVILFGKEVLNRLSVSINGSCGVELFPKQSTSNRLANGLRLPLGINMKPGVWKRSWFEGVEQDVDEQLKWFYAQPVNSGPVVSQISTQVRDRESRIADQTFVPTGMKRATLTKKRKRPTYLRSSHLTNESVSVHHGWLNVRCVLPKVMIIAATTFTLILLTELCFAAGTAGSQARFTPQSISLMLFQNNSIRSKCPESRKVHPKANRRYDSVSGKSPESVRKAGKCPESSMANISALYTVPALRSPTPRSKAKIDNHTAAYE